MGTSLRREAPVAELTRQLQCSARAAELREQHLKENYATSAFAPRSPRARPSADEVKVRAEGDAVQLFDYGRVRSPARDPEVEESPRANGADNFSFQDDISSFQPVPRLGVLERIERLRAQASALSPGTPLGMSAK